MSCENLSLCLHTSSCISRLSLAPPSARPVNNLKKKIRQKLLICHRTDRTSPDSPLWGQRDTEATQDAFISEAKRVQRSLQLRGRNREAEKSGMLSRSVSKNKLYNNEKKKKKPTIFAFCVLHLPSCSPRGILALL